MIRKTYPRFERRLNGLVRPRSEKLIYLSRNKKEGRDQAKELWKELQFGFARAMKQEVFPIPENKSPKSKHEIRAHQKRIRSLRSAAFKIKRLRSRFDKSPIFQEQKSLIDWIKDNPDQVMRFESERRVDTTMQFELQPAPKGVPNGQSKVILRKASAIGDHARDPSCNAIEPG